MRILLLGAGGRLGRALAKTLKTKGEVFGFDHQVLDIADPAAVDNTIVSVRPDCLVNAAAWTDVTGAEASPAAAYAVNADAVGVLAYAARRFDVPLLHYSTDYVFSGEGTTPWTEADVPAPIGVYGASKAEGEALFFKSGARGAVVRAGWLHSGERDFTTAVLARAESSTLQTMVSDQYGTPTETAALASWSAAALAILFSHSSVRIVHYKEAGPYVSRFDYAKAMLASAVSLAERQGDEERAARYRDASTSLRAVSLADGIRPKNCRLATRFAADFPPVNAWIRGVDNSVEKWKSRF